MGNLLNVKSENSQVFTAKSSKMATDTRDNKRRFSDCYAHVS